MYACNRTGRTRDTGACQRCIEVEQKTLERSCVHIQEIQVPLKRTFWNIETNEMDLGVECGNNVHSESTPGGTLKP